MTRQLFPCVKAPAVMCRLTVKLQIDCGAATPYLPARIWWCSACVRCLLRLNGILTCIIQVLAEWGTLLALYFENLRTPLRAGLVPGPQHIMLVCSQPD